MNILHIIKNQKILNYYPHQIEDFPYPGGGTGGGGGGGGTGGGIPSGIIVPGLVISPPGDQALAIGVKRCFTATGTLSLPAMATQSVNIDVGCSKFSNGTWEKTCGTNGPPDDECFSSKLIHKKQSFSVEAKNTLFQTPGPPYNNFDMIFGVKSTNGYYFYWTVYKYCNATAGYCNSDWLAQCRMHYPDGTVVNLASGYVEFAQTFRLRSDGNRLSWDYTTHNNWVNNRYYVTIPEDVGKFQVFTNALWLTNRWEGFKMQVGAYQGEIGEDEYIWSTNCPAIMNINKRIACYTPTLPGSCDLCVSAQDLDPVCINIVSAPLYLHPIGIDCGLCGGDITCVGIPAPTTPVISVTNIDDSIIITWSDSTSFTTGLYYEVEITPTLGSKTTIDVLDSSVTLVSQPDDTYNIRVRALDDCGESAWSNTETITIDTSLFLPSGPANFTISPMGTNPETYTATWDPVVGSVEYEIWIGNPQTTLLATTTGTSLFLGQLISGLELSVRSKDGLGAYTSFSTIQTIP